PTTTQPTPLLPLPLLLHSPPATPLPAPATHLHSKRPAAESMSPKSNTPNHPATPDRSTSNSRSTPSPAQTPSPLPAPHSDSPQSRASTLCHVLPAHL